MRRNLILLVTARLCVSLFAGLLACSRELKLQKGDELFGISEDAVLEVSLRSPQMMAEARRPNPEAAFHYSLTRTHDLRREACAAPPGLAEALAPLRQIRIRNVLSASQSREVLSAHPPREWFELTVGDIVVGGDPFRLILLPQPGKASLAYAHLPDEQLVFLVDGSLLRLSSLQCQTAKTPSAD